MTATDTEFLQRVKATVQAIDPTAEVWLFGSRARGDARDDSDWDFLVLTDGPANWQYKHLLRDTLYDVGLEAGNSISTVIQSNKQKPLLSATDLFRNVMIEGKHL
jgi:uncharacterized protein